MKIEYYLNQLKQLRRAATNENPTEGGVHRKRVVKKKTAQLSSEELNWFKYFVSIARFVWIARQVKCVHNKILYF